MRLTSQFLQQSLSALPACQRFVIAYSGGLDSTVLLHLMYSLQRAGLKTPLLAVHIHHGLQDSADAWQLHCQETCHDLGIAFSTRRITVSRQQGCGLEAAAREGRYQALAEFISQPGNVLLTGHHQDDQAETLLLQLMRGCGVAGLSSMPPLSDFAHGKHLRPLLSVTRADLLDYARHHQLTWVDDHSNLETRYDRNFLRHEIMPLLQKKWPAVVENLARTAGHMAEAQSLLDDLAGQDLARTIDPNDQSLQISGLLAYEPSHQRNLLRYWLRRQGHTTPSQAHLDHIMQDVIRGREDATPCVQWDSVQVRRYRGRLYALAAMASHDPQRVIVWNGLQPLKLAGVGKVQMQRVTGEGLSATRLQQGKVTLRFRQGGEQIRPYNRPQTHDVKKLFQESAVPPWARERTPMLYCDDELAAIAGLGIAQGWQAGAQEDGLMLSWEPEFN